MKNRKLTKQKALASFRVVYSGPKGDVVWKREAWNDYMHFLHLDGQITRHQYDTWSNPF